jgi:hypothetical protein
MQKRTTNNGYKKYLIISFVLVIFLLIMLIVDKTGVRLVVPSENRPISFCKDLQCENVQFKYFGIAILFSLICGFAELKKNKITTKYKGIYQAALLGLKIVCWYLAITATFVFLIGLSGGWV